jgi:drug/metabolite transporter (DMT)-like permease
MTNTQKGLIYMALSCVMVGVMWVAIRWMSDTISTPVIILYRNLFGFLAMMPFLLKHKKAAFKAHNIKLHFARAGSALIAMYCIFYAVTVSPLSQVVAVTYAAPVLAAVGMVVLLGEKIKLRRAVSIIIGFLGMLLVVQPGNMELTEGIMIAIVGSVAIAFTVLVVKIMAGTDKAETITLYNFMITLPISFVIALFYWKVPNLEELLVLAAIGVTISFSQVFLARAFSLADATAVLPLDFIRLLLATFFGVWLFSEPIDPMVMTGAAVILVSTVYTAHRESLASKQEEAASKRE